MIRAKSRVREYSAPRLYEIAFDMNRKGEVDFLVHCFKKYARRPVKRVLDIACGTGPHLIRLAERGSRPSEVAEIHGQVPLALPEDALTGHGPGRVTGEIRLEGHPRALPVRARLPRLRDEDGRIRGRCVPGVLATAAGEGDCEQGRAERGESAHQYVRSCGCHFVIRTGSHRSSGRASRQVTSVCLRKFTSSRFS